ncbi:helix-turn-helix domain-containing protein [Methylocystis parvus]|nr:helix-turn-helix transcriptional regulator [Methylocystis parvus]WBK02355.1 helix-turn-helix domain-containing protein [Methylocystis parvus OBBP]
MTISKIKRIIRRENWTQAEVAKKLGISQGHLSKVLRSKSTPRPELQAKIDRLLETYGGRISPGELASRVEQAALKSSHFRAMIEAALKIVK